MFLRIKIINKKVHLQLNLILEDLHLLEHHLLEHPTYHNSFLQQIILNLKQQKIFNLIIKATSDSKKNQQKRSTLKPTNKESRKLNLTKIIDQENQEFDKFPSLAKLKRASERERIKTEESAKEEKIIKEIIIPEIITVQELANRMAEKTAVVVKTLMKMGVMANATQSLEADTAALVATDLGHNVKLVNEDDILKEIEDEKDNKNDLIKRATSCNNNGTC